MARARPFALPAPLLALPILAPAWLGTAGPPLIVMLLAASPIGEVRVSIPVGVLQYQMGWAEVVVWSLIGNFGIVPFIWWLLPRIERLLRRSDAIAHSLDRLFARTRRHHTKRVERSQEAALVAIVALPVPGAGVWTATIVAYLFGLTWRRSWPYLYSGVVIACFLVMLLVQAGREFVWWL